ncbi:hypothetical protein BC939DRAFT_291393 [Gamsiella multidivaricata]|uniref:uncharacterized protein n=1 Tax=Gamsiella multidivaricata TaxID=101098 RepID=UPI00221EA545|nr:uncharacterized protein BC939DRAFT_291393 [Gamsiella multidivaricata]KAI7818526.1 hypothetical protein BC939DRAFT_291393 [Gamsiella multidivaricata]
MQLYQLGIVGVVLLGFLASSLFTISKKLSSLREPLAVWNTVHSLDVLPLRMRSWIYSLLVGIANPYSRSINVRITEVQKGIVCGIMKETRSTSNRFKCVHAGALVTFGETIGGLALFTHLGKKDRAILTNINVEYIKAVRGLLTASSVVPAFTDTTTDKIITEVIIKNAAFDTVAKLTLTWKTDLKGE